MSMFVENFTAFFSERVFSKVELHIAQNKERKKLKKAFQDAIIRYCQSNSYSKMGIRAVIVDFVNTDGVYELISDMLDTTSGAEKKAILARQFQSHTKGSFSNDFNAEECIEQGLQACKMQLDFSQRALDSLLKASDSTERTTQRLDKKVDALLRQGMLQHTIEETADSIKVRSLVPLYGYYADWDDNLVRANAALQENRKILITGVFGIGKTVLASQLAGSGEYGTSVWIDCEAIVSLPDFTSKLSRAIGLDLSPSAALVDNIVEINAELKKMADTLLIFDHIAPRVDNDVIRMLASIDSRCIVTSSMVALAEYKVIGLGCPPVSICVEMYARHLEKEYADSASIVKIVELADRHPLYIDFWARANAEVRCTPDVFHKKLCSEKDKIEGNIAIRSDKDQEWKKETIVDHIRDVCKHNSGLPVDELQILSVLYQLPCLTVSQRFLEFALNQNGEVSTVYRRLVEKGLVQDVKRENFFCLRMPSLMRRQMEIDKLYDEDTCNSFVFRLIEFFGEGLYQDTLAHGFAFEELCGICEHMYLECCRESEDDDTDGYAWFLYYKAKIYFESEFNKSSISECHRILDMVNVESSMSLIKHVKALLAAALIEYREHGKAQAILNELGQYTDDSSLMISVDNMQKHLRWSNKEYEPLHAELLVDLETANALERIHIYQQLATVAYYQAHYQGGDLEKALEYGVNAIDSLKQENLEASGIASMVYAAYSAALCDTGKHKDAQEWGKKSLDVSIEVFGEKSGHSITARNNYANALFYDGLFEQALCEIEKLLLLYQEAYNELDRVVMQAKAMSIVLKLMLGKRQDFTGKVKELFIECSKTDELQRYILDLFLVAGEMLADGYDMKKLRLMLDVVRTYVYSESRYMGQYEASIGFSRLELIYTVGTYTFRVSPRGNPGSSVVHRNYDALKKMVKQGFFDNREPDDSENFPETERPLHFLQIDRGVASIEHNDAWRW